MKWFTVEKLTDLFTVVVMGTGVSNVYAYNSLYVSLYHEMFLEISFIGQNLHSKLL